MCKCAHRKLLFFPPPKIGQVQNRAWLCCMIHHVYIHQITTFYFLQATFQRLLSNWFLKFQRNFKTVAPKAQFYDLFVLIVFLSTSHLFQVKVFIKCYCYMYLVRINILIKLTNNLTIDWLIIHSYLTLNLSQF